MRAAAPSACLEAAALWGVSSGLWTCAAQILAYSAVVSLSNEFGYVLKMLKQSYAQVIRGVIWTDRNGSGLPEITPSFIHLL